MGILMGYSLSTAHDTHLGNITITGNEIYNVMNYQNDGGAIYNCGQHNSLKPKSYIQNNHIYNIPHTDDASGNLRAGIYLDQGSNNVIVTGNYGDYFPLWSNKNLDVYLNYNTNEESQGNRFGINNFGDVNQNNSFWIKKITRDSHYLNGIRVESPGFPPPIPLTDASKGDMGVSFVDVDHNKRKDMIYYWWKSPTESNRAIYLNKWDHWDTTGGYKYALPDLCPTAIDGLKDAGVRFVDVDGDGYDDLLQYRRISSGQYVINAYKNTGNGWVSIPAYNPPYPFSIDNIGDIGTRFVDVDHNGLKDIVYNRVLANGTPSKAVYLNNGTTWVLGDQKYIPPVVLYKDGEGDLGVRFVDVNGDGYDDLLQYLWKGSGEHVINAYINTGNGWVSNPAYNPPHWFSEDFFGDNGTQFVDVDHNGLKDIVFNRVLGYGTCDKGVYLNSGTVSSDGTVWVWGDIKYIPPVTLYKDISIGGDQGVRFVDLNGDGYEDIIQGFIDPNGQFTNNFYLNRERMFYTASSPPYQAKMENAQSKESLLAQEIPDKYSLLQNYPNPFNPATTIIYALPARSQVRLQVFNILGQMVKELINNEQDAGYQSVHWNANVASGMYFYRIEATSLEGLSKQFVETKKMLLLK